MINMIDHYVSGEKLYDRLIAPVCERHSLTAMELNILLFLANNPSHDTATEIVAYRHLTKSHVSTSLRSLQQKGLVIGEYRNGNRRTVHLLLTPVTAAIVADGRQAQTAYRSLLLDGFTEAEKTQLEQFIDRIDRNMQTHAAATDCENGKETPYDR